MARDLPPLNALRAFEAAARLGSLSEAARELHVTHGAISRQVRQLEEQLGLALLAKEGRGVKLTDAGLRLRDAASDAFERLRSTCAELQRQTAEAPFVLGCPGSLLARWFIPRLDRLNRELPELRLQLSASEGELDPRRPGLDATLWYAEPPWPADMRVFELAAERICIPPRARRPGRAGRAATAWNRRSSGWGRASNTSISCWRRRWPASAWPSPRSSWWPTTWPPDACWRPGASSKPRRSWRCGCQRDAWTAGPSSWPNG